MLDLTGTRGISCWAVQHRRRLCKLTLGSKLTGGVLLKSNCGELVLPRAPGVLCWAVQCRWRLRKLKFELRWHRVWESSAAGDPAISGLLVFGSPVLPVTLQRQACSNSARTRPVGCCRGRIVAGLTWRKLRWPCVWRSNAAVAPAISGLLELGSNSTGGVMLGSNRGSLDLTGAPGTRVGRSSTAGAPASSRSARI